ncbi:glycogen debranching protein GlgX [Wenxinia saemankumensis]|uniref:Glycogen operon protein n=1 Tax=Wenxinia saemankumensis TaxID=1447782 RepID=A0A1M6EW46_9RHOB|nr:glycogen debranching protein GlgX [Wenxinia saemankumensis]SHI89620.1 glycogen operon protein [Wenxinia saemankumensis]
MTTSSFDRHAAWSHRLGAQYDGRGTNFALFSDHAERVELCLFDGETERRLDLPEMQGGIWFGYLPDVHPGQRYGYRVHGPYDPASGHRFNPNKLLIDPYARQLDGSVTHDPAIFGYEMESGDDTTFDTRDSAPFVPKGYVTDPSYDWDEDKVLRHRWRDSVFYEAHVRGMTMQRPDVPEDLRGTFAGLAQQPVIDHLRRIGVTALELLPVHTFLQDDYLLEKGLTNYWGYNTLNFFAPERRYLKSGEWGEIKDMVRRYHDADIEVILDVVYNHTAEGSELGPTLSFRGIDNLSYYLHGEDARHCYDTTGCGNTVNVAHPMVLRMVLDSLRHWVQEMHVDGFRFDLASTLGREATGFEREGSFFAAIRQDPVLSSIKLIAEPWDIGDGGYQVGGFPWPFREWNDKFRDDVRGFWRRGGGLKGALAERLCGSPVQFDHSNRPASSSINFVAAHDGFTLWDVVSYNEKHNEANGEDNRDGHDHNLSDNMGVEGAAEDADITAARLRRARAMLSTLMLSRGVPMLLGGDEVGNSQGGNNNAYCQDNEIGWIDWDTGHDLSGTVADLAELRRRIPALRETRFDSDTCVTRWFGPDGADMEDGDWDDDSDPVVMCHEAEGQAVLIVVNGGDDAELVLHEEGYTLDFVSEPETATLDGTALSMGWQTVAVLSKAIEERTDPDDLEETDPEEDAA